MLCRSHKISAPHKRHVTKLVDVIMRHRSASMQGEQGLPVPYLHEDGSLANEDDPAWPLALAEFAKDHNRIVTNAPLAQVAADADADDQEEIQDMSEFYGAGAMGFQGREIAEGGSEGEDEDDEKDQRMSDPAMLAFLNQNLMLA